MAEFRFYCVKCKSKFSINKEGVDQTSQLTNVFCPSCGDKWGKPNSKIELDLGVFKTSQVQSRSSVAKENLEASKDAEERARDDKAYLDRENPQVMPGVRKSTVDKINERAGNELDI